MVRRADLTIRQTGLRESEAILAISGELDLSTIETLVDQVDTHLQRRVDCLTLDLRDLAFMDSTGLRLLIELHDRAQHEPWSLKLIAPRHDAASRVLKITGADVALPFEPENGR